MGIRVLGLILLCFIAFFWFVGDADAKSNRRPIPLATCDTVRYALGKPVCGDKPQTRRFRGRYVPRFVRPPVVKKFINKYTMPRQVRVYTLDKRTSRQRRAAARAAYQARRNHR